MNADELRRQVQGHMRSLQLAGVEWVPQGSPLEIRRQTPAPENPPTIMENIPTVPSEASNLNAEDDLTRRRTELELLAKCVADCTRCKALASTRTQTVFSDGPIGAELCFVGEAPGADEDAQGIPFVGKAGELLTRIIVAMGFTREEVYICNTLKCRPPGNRTPLPEETANCREYFDRQLELAQPKYIVALGGTAATNLLQISKPLGQMRGKFYEYNGIPVVVTYHPAYLLPHRAPEKKKEVWDDMKMLLAKMGREVPKK